MYLPSFNLNSLLVFIVILALSNLGSGFGSATLAKDSTTNDKDELLSQVLGTQTTTESFTITQAQGSDQDSRKLCTEHFALPAPQAQDMIEMCPAGRTVKVERVWSDGSETDVKTKSSKGLLFALHPTTERCLGFTVLLAVLAAVATKICKAREFMGIKGNWHSAWSLEPLREAAQFATEFSSYIDAKKEEYNGCAIFKIHPGIRAIALTDHRSCDFFFRAPTCQIDREDKLRFGPIACSSQILKSATPALPSGPSTHNASLSLTLKILHSRSADLEQAWAEQVEDFVSDAELPVIGTMVALEVGFILRWILGLKTGELPSMHDLEWARKNLAKDLNTDSSMSWVVYKLMYERKFSSDDEVHLKRLLVMVRTSPYFSKYKTLADEYGLGEDVDRWLLFTFIAAGLALGLTLHPALCRLASNPDVVSSLQAEVVEATVDIRPSRSLADSSRVDHLPLLDSVANELLRLATAPLFVFRKAQEDLLIPFGEDSSLMKVPAGALLMASLAHMHTDPIIFPHPHEFVPRRFMDNPSLMDQLFLFGMSPQGPDRANPYGCAGYGSGIALPLFKMAITSLITDFSWQLEQTPTFALPRFNGSAGPVDLKFVFFEKRCTQCDHPLILQHSNDLASAEMTFLGACEIVSTNKGLLAETSKYLELYGLYKQARSGDAPSTGPSRMQGVLRTKWAAWDKKRGMSRLQAEINYISIVAEAVGQVPKSNAPSIVLKRELTEPHSRQFFATVKHEIQDDNRVQVLYQLDVSVTTMDNPRTSGQCNAHILSFDFVGPENETLLTVQMYGGSLDSPDNWAIGGCGYSSGQVSFTAAKMRHQPVAVRCKVISHGQLATDEVASSWVELVQLSVPELLQKYSFFVAGWTPQLAFETQISGNVPLARSALSDKRRVWRWKSWLDDHRFPKISVQDDTYLLDSYAYQMDANPATEGHLFESMITMRHDDNSRPTGPNGYIPTSLKQPDIVSNPNRDWRSDDEFAHSFLSG